MLDLSQLTLFCCRKHTLNCHRMRPALFQVLCEIKEKTGEHYLHLWHLVTILAFYFVTFVKHGSIITVLLVLLPYVGIVTSNAYYFCASHIELFLSCL